MGGREIFKWGGGGGGGGGGGLLPCVFVWMCTICVHCSSIYECKQLAFHIQHIPFIPVYSYSQNVT